MREKAFENKVKDFLKKQGCWYLKTWSNGVQRAGVPDLLICCNGYFLGVELKAEGGVVSELQKFNLRWIRASNGVGMVLYPCQFDQFKKLITQLKKEPIRMFSTKNGLDFLCIFDN